MMEQKWFAHVLTSDYPLPAGMSVTAWGGFKISYLHTNLMILKTRDVKELLVNIQVQRAYTIAGRLTVTVVRQVYSSTVQFR
ncbi:hypothetical protein NXX52_13250 [Bacteroides ovatus]|nr:hypothetical protein [Bacteroides ovatus]